MSEGQRVHLPVYDRVSSLAKDGRRQFVVPADVKGRFVLARRVVFALLIGIWALLPWIPINGRPALFLDVPLRRFYLFGGSFNAQDFWLVFFVLTAVLFSLVYATALLGRAWCGWACPQTVFLEGVFRPIERLIEGPRNIHLKRDSGPWTANRVARKVAKHTLFVVAAALVSHVFLAYFVSIPSLLEMVRRSPAEHPQAFAWMVATTAIFYGNFAWFREQLCLVICPYGRLQGVLVDDDSLVVGYDVKRGEPRGKGARKKAEDAPARGDCVDCNRCVVVCPTGIDIRNGLQLDCIACTQCIDACDDVMTRLEKPRGLIRYDSMRGLRGEKRRIVRPRLVFYTVLLLIGAVVGFFAFQRHTPFEANLLRLPGAPYVVEGEVVRNSLEIHLLNKVDREALFTLELPEEGVEVVTPSTEITLPAMGSRRVPLFVRFPRTGEAPPRLRVVVRMQGVEEPRVVEAPLLAPAR